MEILPNDPPPEATGPPPNKEVESLKQDNVHLMLCRRLADLPERKKALFCRRLIDSLIDN